MKKIDVPLISDVLFYTAASWIFALGILRYYRIALGISVAVSSLIALSVGLTVFTVIYFKHRRQVLGKREQERRDALLLHLALEKDERVRAALLTAFLADGKESHCEQNGLNVDGETVIPLFTMQPVSADAVARLIREYGNNPFILACNSLTPEAEKLLRSFGRIAICGDEIYTIFSRTNTMPEPLICGEIPRKTAKQKLRRSFSKKNARPYFVGGLLLLVMSLFTFFPIYYLITGSILLISSVCIRVFGYA